MDIAQILEKAQTAVGKGYDMAHEAAVAGDMDKLAEIARVVAKPAALVVKARPILKNPAKYENAPEERAAVVAELKTGDAVDLDAKTEALTRFRSAQRRINSLVRLQELAREMGM